MRFPNDQFYLKSEEEMREIFKDFPQALDNTEKIAKRCKVDFTFGEYHIPEFISPDGKSNERYLRELSPEESASSDSACLRRRCR